MQGTVDTEASRCAEVSVATAARTVALPECWAEAWRRRLLNCTLIFSDIMLAFLVWEAAIMLQMGWEQGPLSEVAIATVASNVVVWGLLVLSAYSNRVRLARAIEAGAAGILHKSSLLEEIVDAPPALRGALEYSHRRRLLVFLGEGSRI